MEGRSFRMRGNSIERTWTTSHMRKVGSSRHFHTFSSPEPTILLAGPDFLSMRRAFVSYSRPIRFDGKSVNRGLPVLDQARALDPCHRPEGSWTLGTRMIFIFSNFVRQYFRFRSVKFFSNFWWQLRSIGWVYTPIFKKFCRWEKN